MKRSRENTPHNGIEAASIQIQQTQADWHKELSMRTGPDGVCIAARDGVIRAANQAYGKMLGYAQDELIGKNLSLLFDADAAQLIEQHLQLAIDNGYTRFEISQQREDSNAMDLEIAITYVDQGDDSLLIVSIRYVVKTKKVEEQIKQLQDITSQSQAEQVLRDSQERFRMFAELSLEGIMIYDDGFVLDANNKFAQMLGYELTECIGTNILEFIKLEYRDLVLEKQHAFSQESYEVMALTKDGSTFPVAITDRPISYKGKMVHATSIRDISARKESEEQLRQREAQLAIAQHIAHLGSWEWDIQNDIISWSNEMFQIFGADHISFDGDYRAVIEARIHSEDKARVSNELKRILEKRRSRPMELRLLFPDNVTHYIWVETSIALDENGDVMRLIGTVQDITERRQAEEALRQSEELFSKAFHTSPALMSITTLNEGRFIDFNDSFLQVLGYTRDELVDRTVEDICLWVDQKERKKIINEIKEHGSISAMEVNVHNRSGEIKTVLISAQPILIGDEASMLTVGTDISERKKSGEQMRKLSSALEQTADSVMVTNKNGIIEYVNSAFEMITGYSKEQAVGKKSNIMRSHMHDQPFYEDLWGTILAGKVFSDVIINRKYDGSLYYEEKTITPLLDDDGNIKHFVSTGKDITERMQTQERLQYLAHHDVLTELPNRVLFADRLDQGLARAKWHDRAIAVMFLDLDRFKIINDTLGHDVGDRALQALSEILISSVRAGDTVARVGGDEFAIILEDVASPDDIAPVARKILQNLSKPFQLEEREFFVTTSIGISLYPTDGEDTQTLLKNADIAMYRAKEQGRNTYQFYSSDMSAKAFERLSLETNLRHALSRNEFVLYYQPQYDLALRKITGVEALLRWQHPDLGIVAPADFVPLLEETGLIVPVGEWVLQNACEQFGRWQEQGLGPMRVAINLSGRQFDEPDLAANLLSIAKSTGIDPRWLEFEITESVLMKNKRLTMDTLEAFEELGVRLAIDDFGTGYSSLSYLKRFPIDTFKIDRSFVRDVNTDPDDAAIVQAIIAMARSLKLHVIAEGVETKEQLAFLRGLKCDAIQGFLFSRPLTVDQMTRSFQQNHKI